MAWEVAQPLSSVTTAAVQVSRITVTTVPRTGAVSHSLENRPGQHRGRPGRPGPSYLDPGSGGPENDFTNRNTTFMTWNLMHMALMIKNAGGIPAHGNQRSEWDAGCRFEFTNPDYR